MSPEKRGTREVLCLLATAKIHLQVSNCAIEIRPREEQ